MRFQVCIYTPSVSFLVTPNVSHWYPNFPYCPSQGGTCHRRSGKSPYLLYQKHIWKVPIHYGFHQGRINPIDCNYPANAILLKLSCSFLLPFSARFLLIEVGYSFVTYDSILYLQGRCKIVPSPHQLSPDIASGVGPHGLLAVLLPLGFLPLSPAPLSLTAGTVKTALWSERRATAPGTLVKLSIHSWLAEAPDRKHFTNVCSVFLSQFFSALLHKYSLLRLSSTEKRDHVCFFSMSLGTRLSSW